MTRPAQMSKEKIQSIITLRQEGPLNLENLNFSSSADTKTMKRYDEIAFHEDYPRKERARVSSAVEDTFIRVTSLRNSSQNTLKNKSEDIKMMK